MREVWSTRTFSLGTCCWMQLPAARRSPASASLALSRRSPFSESTASSAGGSAYIAPEQTGRTNRSIDSRSDLYGLGATYEMLTGATPFAGVAKSDLIRSTWPARPTPPSQCTAGVPDIVSAIVMKLLAKAADDRYRTAAGLAVDLERCLVEWSERGVIDTFPLRRRKPAPAPQTADRLRDSGPCLSVGPAVPATPAATSAVEHSGFCARCQLQ